MHLRVARLPWLVLLAYSGYACDVYDPGLAPVMTVGKTEAGVPDASPGDAKVCVAAAERCNDIDDDCDGQVDEATAARLDCETRVVHARTECQSGYCLRLACLSGYFNCDGRPENGCESSCACGSSCKDAASPDDSGSDDSGPNAS